MFSDQENRLSNFGKNKIEKRIMKKFRINCGQARILAAIMLLTILVARSKAQTYSFKVLKHGKGQPVILIPGLTCDGAVWDETVATLKKDYECHVLTLPGFAGHLPIDLGQGYLPQVRKEIIAYVHDQHLVHPIVIGHSLGGHLALDIASTKPNLVSRLVIVDALPFLGALHNPNATEASAKAVAEGMKKRYSDISDEQYKANQLTILKTMITDEEMVKVALEWSLSSDRSSVNRAMYELMTTDLRDDMVRINIPVMVLGSWVAAKEYGVTKEMVLASFSNQYRQLKGVEISLSEKGRHFIMWDDFEFYINEIDSFLSRNKVN